MGADKTKLMKIKNEFRGIIPKRRRDSHKGDYGRVFVLAGSVGMTGAAALCAQAVLLCGSGLVTLGIPESLNDIMEVKLTEVMTKPLPETIQRSLSLKALEEIIKFSDNCDVVAMGPGLSQNPQTQKLVRRVVASLRKPMVVDADGINALAAKAELLIHAKAHLILTPHSGEMARVAGISVGDIQRERLRSARAFAKRYRVTLVLKGHHSIVASPAGNSYVNKTGNPGMATAGMGDILTGMLASFLGQEIEPFEAAKLAVYLHGLAGDLAAKEKGEASLIASDVLGKLPEAIKLVGHK